MSTKLSEAKKNLEQKITELEQNLGANSDSFTMSNYLKNLKALCELTRDQYAKDAHGLDKKLTPERLAEFKTLYEKCGRDGELALMNNNKTSAAHKATAEIQKIIAEDLNILNGVDPKKLNETSSMQKIMAEGREKTVDITGKNLGTLSGAMSERIPFNYVEMNGKKNPGVFTPKTILDIEAKFDEYIKQLSDKYPQYEDLLSDFKEAGIKYVHDQKVSLGKTKTDNREQNFKSFLGMLTVATGNTKVDDTSFLKAYTSVMPENKALTLQDTFDFNQDGRAFKNDLFTSMSYAYNYMLVNETGAGIKNKSRLDNRNTAMSDVAKLLGLGHLICESKQMTVINNGKKIEGSFMALAKGEDVNHPSPTAVQYTDKNFKNSSGTKDISELQLVDVICGNIDRHAANMFYNFDTSSKNPKDHKFTGLQGIDNDCSFGTYVPKNPDDYMKEFPSFNSLKFVSRSSYERITSITPDMLELVLRKHNLPNEQINAARQRFSMLSNYLRNSAERYENLSTDDSISEKDKKIYAKDINAVIPGTARIIDDDQFKNIDISKVANERNYFQLVYSFPTFCKDSIIMHNKFQPKEIKEPQAFVMDDAELKKVSDLMKTLNNATQFGRSSDAYRNLQSSVVKYNEFCKLNKGMVLSSDLYDVRTKFLKGIKDAADLYVYKKRDVKKPSEYTQKRIDLATQISKDLGDEIGSNYYDKVTEKMTPEAQQRYADGLHLHADASLDEFNARMREMAEKIHNQHKPKEPIVNRNDVKQKPDEAGPSLI